MEEEMDGFDQKLFI